MATRPRPGPPPQQQPASIPVAPAYTPELSSVLSITTISLPPDARIHWRVLHGAPDAIERARAKLAGDVGRSGWADLGAALAKVRLKAGNRPTAKGKEREGEQAKGLEVELWAFEVGQESHLDSLELEGLHGAPAESFNPAKLYPSPSQVVPDPHLREPHAHFIAALRERLLDLIANRSNGTIRRLEDGLVLMPPEPDVPGLEAWGSGKPRPLLHVVLDLTLLPHLLLISPRPTPLPFAALPRRASPHTTPPPTHLALREGLELRLLPHGERAVWVKPWDGNTGTAEAEWSAAIAGHGCGTGWADDGWAVVRIPPVVGEMHGLGVGPTVLWPRALILLSLCSSSTPSLSGPPPPTPASVTTPSTPRPPPVSSAAQPANALLLHGDADPLAWRSMTHPGATASTFRDPIRAAVEQSRAWVEAVDEKEREERAAKAAAVQQQQQQQKQAAAAIAKPAFALPQQAPPPPPAPAPQTVYPTPPDFPTPHQLLPHSAALPMSMSMSMSMPAPAAAPVSAPAAAEDDWGGFGNFDMGGMDIFGDDGMGGIVTEDDFSFFDEPAVVPGAGAATAGLGLDNLESFDPFGGPIASTPSFLPPSDPGIISPAHGSASSQTPQHATAHQPTPSVDTPMSLQQQHAHLACTPSEAFSPPTMQRMQSGRTPRTPYTPFTPAPTGFGLMDAGVDRAEIVQNGRVPQGWEALRFDGESTLASKYAAGGKFAVQPDSASESDSSDDEMFDSSRPALGVILGKRRRSSRATGPPRPSEPPSWYDALCAPRAHVVEALRKAKRQRSKALERSGPADRKRAKFAIVGSKKVRKPKAQRVRWTTALRDDESDWSGSDTSVESRASSSLDAVRRPAARPAEPPAPPAPPNGVFLLLLQGSAPVVQSPMGHAQSGAMAFMALTPCSPPAPVAGRVDGGDVEKVWEMAIGGGFGRGLPGLSGSDSRTVSASLMEKAHRLLAEALEAGSAGGEDIKTTLSVSTYLELTPSGPSEVGLSPTAVKTRRRSSTVSVPPPPAPRLALLDAPAYAVGHVGAVLHTSPVALRFWDKMGFSPLSGRKDVMALAVFEGEAAGAEARERVGRWLAALEKTWEGCSLGRMTRGQANGLEDGVAGFARDSIAAAVAAVSGQLPETHPHFVIYVLGSSTSSPIDATLAQTLSSPDARIVVQPLPLADVLDASLSSSLSTARLKQLAFSTFDRLLRPVERLNPRPVPPFSRAADTLVQYPVFALGRSSDPRADFTSWPLSLGGAWEKHTMLHVAYALDDEAEWIFAACVDERGEGHAQRAWRSPGRIGKDAVQHAIASIWEFARECAARASVEWRIVFCKSGRMSYAEFEVWQALIAADSGNFGPPVHISLACIDPCSPVPLLRPPRDAEVPKSPKKTGESPSMLLIDASRAVYAVYPSHRTTLFPPVPTPFSDLASPTDFSETPIISPPHSSLLLSVPQDTDLSLARTPLSPFRHPALASISALAVHLLSTAPDAGDLTPERQLRDVTRSFHDLAVLAADRWALCASAKVVPFHVATVEGMRDLARTMSGLAPAYS